VRIDQDPRCPRARGGLWRSAARGLRRGVCGAAVCGAAVCGAAVSGAAVCGAAVCGGG